jgi:hypothetical protein
LYSTLMLVLDQNEMGSKWNIATNSIDK